MQKQRREMGGDGGMPVQVTKDWWPGAQLCCICFCIYQVVSLFVDCTD